MTNDELFGAISKLTQAVQGVEKNMVKLCSDFENDKERQEEKISLIMKLLDEAKEGRKVLHKKADDHEARLQRVEQAPALRDWEAVRKQVGSWLWKAAGIMAFYLIVKSLPDIFKFMGIEL